jgi:hypothetical protein
VAKTNLQSKIATTPVAKCVQWQQFTTELVAKQHRKEKIATPDCFGSYTLLEDW